MLIDDTYNSSPAAAAAILQTLYSLQAHNASLSWKYEWTWWMCRPKNTSSGAAVWRKLTIVGGDHWVKAEKYLAPAARSRGCQVKSFKERHRSWRVSYVVFPEEGSIVLAKGSQGNIYAEGAIKNYSTAPTTIAKLVRQSPEWIRIKPTSSQALAIRLCHYLCTHPKKRMLY